MRKIFIILTAAAMLAAAVIPAHALALSARAAIVMDTAGCVVYADGADTRLPMASTTKIMTALVAIESGRLGETVTIPKEAEGVEGSSVYLKAGDSCTLEALTWALMLESANDAATAIAVTLGGSVEGFAALMNEKAAALGLSDTHFTNPHGLAHEAHYTTARELALLAVYAMKNDTFRAIVSSKSHTVEIGGQMRSLHNHNKLLRLYDGAIGVKTGFTKASGRCLVSAAVRDGVTLVAVTLNAPDDWNDHRALLDLGFETLEAVTLIEPGGHTCRIPCIGGDAADIPVSNRDGITVTLPKNHGHISRTIEVPRYLWAPVEAGKQIGRIVFREGGRVIGEAALYADTGAARVQYKQNIFEKIFN